ncbi:DUF805 domain-containing protein [Hymenobacter sp. HMF4947]|uniref:DUF805 domain-containing protein n=1 Tax=Hymenobacter ginkgonis TaxID=2682976 RepID=A0A7K1TGF1_9BACT|nr:DUF805 domain-containing protein [Hymenobacter ginkgonis]MVN77251.1 DUF805 domain-containing protein [Hymenobacter ginkgonis]
MNYYFTVLKKYANVDGRARRAEYWYFILFNFTLLIIIGVAKADFFGLVFSLAILIPSTTVGMRRMHDVGRSGWYIAIPIYGLVLACMEGQKGPNEYGPDPKNPAGLADKIPYSYK